MEILWEEGAKAMAEKAELEIRLTGQMGQLPPPGSAPGVGLPSFNAPGNTGLMTPDMLARQRAGQPAYPPPLPPGFSTFLPPPLPPGVNAPKAATAAGTGAAGAGAAGVAAAAGPAGIALMVAEKEKQAFDAGVRAVGDFGRAIMAVDADGFSAAISDTIKQLGPLGQAAWAVTDVFLGLLAATDATARRYAAFSPELAATQAQVNVNRLMREINRAQEMGPELANYLQRRDDVNAKIEALLQRLSVRLLPMIESGLNFMEVTIEAIDIVVRFIEENGATFNLAANILLAGIPAILSYFNTVIEQNRTSLGGNIKTGQQFIDALIGSLLNANNAAPPPPPLPPIGGNVP